MSLHPANDPLTLTRSLLAQLPHSLTPWKSSCPIGLRCPVLPGATGTLAREGRCGGTLQLLCMLLGRTVEKDSAVNRLGFPGQTFSPGYSGCHG